MRLIFLLTAFLLSCSSFNTSPTDTEFNKYIKIYENYKIQYKKVPIKYYISVNFLSLKSPTIGQCQITMYGTRAILIDPNYWYDINTSDIDRELLILHEFGHCDLNLDHYPNSIMSPRIIDETIYLYNKDYYLENLFLQLTPTI